MKGQAKNTGFTLVELIIVIVILGILAITAAPRFIDIAGDAKASQLNSLRGALKSGAELVYAKSVLQGKESGNNQFIDIDGDGVDDVITHAGYPAVAGRCTRFLGHASMWMNFELPTECVGNDFEGDYWTGTVTGARFIIYPKGFSDKSENCYVEYIEASGTVRDLSVEAVTTGC